MTRIWPTFRLYGLNADLLPFFNAMARHFRAPGVIIDLMTVAHSFTNAMRVCVIIMKSSSGTTAERNTGITGNGFRQI
jgi:hypothetical protein